MKRTLILLGLLCCVNSFAAERELIWPKGKMPDAQPHQIAAMTDESSAKDFKPQKHRTAYIEWFDAPAADKRNGGCMVLISGGAYNSCCDVGYVKQWSEKLTELGFQCVNLVYRTPRPEGIAFYQTAWEDLQRAIRIVRSEAAERGFDEFGQMLGEDARYGHTERTPYPGTARPLLPAQQQSGNRLLHPS